MGEVGIPFGSYRLIKRLARGGMAEVFLARQRGPEGWGRKVAVKRILPHLVETGDFVRMFLDEARLAALLNHPNVVHIYEFGKVEEYYFIAMEFVDGVDAARLISSKVRVPPEIVARVGADAAAGLHHAHMSTDPEGRPLGIVHRDVSPQNLLITYDGVVKIVDFGIAKAAYQAEQTRPGVVKGKYAYMSPEQTTGRALDGRSDVFSLGLVLWELLAGKVAVRRDDPVEAMKVIRDGRLPPIESIRRDVPVELAAAVNRALRRNREERPAAAELGLELESYLRTASRLATSLVVAAWVREQFPREPSASGSHEAIVAEQGTQRVEAGGTEPGADTDVDAEVARGTAIAAVPAPQALPRTRRWWVLAAMIGGIAAAVVASLLVATGGRVTPPKARPVAANPPLALDAAPAPIVVVSRPAELIAATLDVITSPAGATVTIDGAELADRTPAHLELAPGTHELVVSLAKHTDVARTITLAAGEHRSVELTLTPTPKAAPRASVATTGYLTVRTIPWSDVYLRGRKLGTTPLADIELAVGTHLLTFKNPQVGSRKRRVSIRPGQTTKLSLTLAE